MASAMLRLMLLLLPLLRRCISDNPTAIVKPYPGPDPGYILAESDGGLSNRLRVLAAYMWIGADRFQGAHLVFIWDVNDACPGHFLQLFEPIPNVVFATNSSRYVLDKNAKIVYENSLAVMTWTLQMNNIPKNKFGRATWGDIEYMMYSKFAPTAAIMRQVDEFVSSHNICNMSAMHIRATDLAKHMARKKQAVNIQTYYDFVDRLPTEEPVYLLTDNPETQHAFLTKYGRKKILVYAEITPSVAQKPLALVNSHSGAAGASSANETSHLEHIMKGGHRRHEKYPRRLGLLNSSTGLSEDHRYTSVEHTLIDVMIAAHAKHFKPAIYSSLSELVKIFGHIGRKDRRWCR